MNKISLIILLVLMELITNAQNFAGAKQLGGISDDQPGTIVTDAAGNIYTIGFFSDIVDFDPGPAVSSYTAQGAQDVFINKYDAFGSLIWVRQMSATGGFVYESLSVTSSGDVYAACTFSGTVDFNPVLSAGSNTLISAGNISSFICKLNTSGNLLWTKQFENIGNKYTKHITLDASNMYLTGSFAGPVDFDPGAGTYTLTTTASSYDAFICKFDLNGNFVWAKNLGGNADDLGNSSAVDLSGNVYVTGTYSSPNCDFDPSASTHLVGGSGHDDGFVCKLDAGGNYVWVNALPALAVNSHITEPLIICNKFNQVYISGYFFDQTMIGSTPLYAPSGSMDMYMARLNAGGNVLWAYNLGGTGDDYIKSVISDTLGNVYVTGGFGNTVDFDHGPGNTSLSSTGVDYDGFTLKTDSLGAFGWVKHFKGSNQEGGASLAINRSGDLYVFGFFNDTIQINPPSTLKNITHGGYDIFITKLSCAPLTVNAVDSVCIGTSATFSASGTSIYLWSTGQATASITVTPTITTSYTITGSNGAGCNNTQSFYLIVNPNCQDVWPGDANSDGIADNLDVLELGLHFAQTGPGRATTSNSWQSYFSNNWTGTISNGKNLNHSDCNGDGTIDNNDTLAIYNNYGLTHAFKENQNTAVNPALSIVPDQSFVNKGSWGTASIFLGEAAAPITNINGVAFTLNFDETLIETNSIYLEYPASFINTGNQNLKFSKPDFANGKVYAATTHTNNTNVSGNGKIAVLHYKIKSSLTTNTILNIGIVNAKQSNATGALSPLTTGSATLAAIGASVGMDEYNVGNTIGIYPNPANNVITIYSSTMLEKIELSGITGQVILSEKASGNQCQIDLSVVANGVYFVTISGLDKKAERKKLVVQH